MMTATHRANLDPPPPASPHAVDEDELAAIYRAKLSLRVLIVAVTALALTLATLLAIGVWLIRGTQVHNTALTEETHNTAAETQRLATQTKATADLIRSCVNPGGKCYERGQAQTGAAVDSLNLYVVLASACAAHATGLGADTLPVPALTKIVQDCVLTQLAASPPPPQP